MECTNKALKLIENEMWFEAQQAFREAVENEPCCETYNNLGVFYIDNGIQYKNKESKPAREQGYNYLVLAQHCDLDFKNLVAIAEYNYYYGDVDEACKLYKKSSEIKADYRVYNNLACGCYKLGGYIKASMYFDKALKIADNNIDDIKISYCYSLLKCQEDYTEILNSISDVKWTVLDRFILYYFNGDFKRAYELSKAVIENWEFNLPVLAMLYEVIEENNVADLKRFDEEILKLAMNDKKRAKTIGAFEYVPVMLWQCKYIGCEKH